MERMYMVQTLVKVAFLVSYWLLPNYCVLLGCVACFMAVYRRQKRVEFSRAYLDRFLRNQYGSNIMFILSFSSIPLSLFFYVPLALHFLTGIAEFAVSFGQGSIFSRFSPKLSIVKKYSNQIKTTKAYVEIIYAPIHLVMLIFGLGRIISVLVYVQYLVLRYRIGGIFSTAIQSVDQDLTLLTQKIGAYSIYRKIKDIIASGLSRLQP